MVQAVKEITEWSTEYPSPNHEYLLDGDWILAYRPWGKNQPVVLKSPIRIDRRNRKFQQLTENPFKIARNPNLIAVSGSAKQTYWVDTVEKTCTCPGFRYRSSCRHVNELSVA
jgi:hypothetical protein